MPKAHARLSPSAAVRWINCPGSVALSAVCPPAGSSDYADEGTAAHRLADALVAEVRRAEIDPLGRELAVGGHEWHEIGGKGVAPTLCLGAADAVRGDLQQPHVHLSGGHGVVEDLVEHLRIGVLSAQYAVFIGFSAALERFLILRGCLLSAHRVHSLDLGYN